MCVLWMIKMQLHTYIPVPCKPYICSSDSSDAVFTHCEFFLPTAYLFFIAQPGFAYKNVLLDV